MEVNDGQEKALSDVPCTLPFVQPEVRSMPFHDSWVEVEEQRVSMPRRGSRNCAVLTIRWMEFSHSSKPCCKIPGSICRQPVSGVDAVRPSQTNAVVVVVVVDSSANCCFETLPRSTRPMPEVSLAAMLLERVLLLGRTFVLLLVWCFSRIKRSWLCVSPSLLSYKHSPKSAMRK